MNSKLGLCSETLSQKQNQSVVCWESPLQFVISLDQQPRSERGDRGEGERREAEGVHGSASNTFISLLLIIQEQRAHAYSTEH